MMHDDDFNQILSMSMFQFTIMQVAKATLAKASHPFCVTEID